MNHSAVHEFSILKLGFPFVLGILLIAYCFTSYKKKSTGYFFSLTVLVIAIYVFYIQGNIHSYYENRLSSGDELSGFERIVEELNDYNHVFFSFTDSIPINPPMSIAITKKMVYKIDAVSDIKVKFPSLNPNAKVLILTNEGAVKDDRLLQNEQQALERAELIKKTNQFAVYRLLLE
jgi:hypothetical protein